MLNDFLSHLSQLGFSETRQAQFQRFYERLDESLQKEGATLASTLTNAPNAKLPFLQVCNHSEYCQQQLVRNPQWLASLISEKATQARDYESYKQACNKALSNCEQLEAFNTAIRLLRNEAMLGIIWRDFNRQVDTLQTTQELSWLAELCVQYGLDFHFRELSALHGIPRDKNGDQQNLLVLGMGKLGAGELNLSSDIDLIFAYPHSGQTDGGRKPLSNQEFFTRLGKRLIHSLDNVNADGFVFRVDMRLRPFGQSGALASHFDALEDYYQTQGREWERYAMVKARVIASTHVHSNESIAATHELNKLIRSFTYRKYVDFSVIEALRKLKLMISQEVARRKLGDDVKLGAGGIREIEFIAQAFQLIRGGRDTQLQDNRLTVILPLLEELNCLPEGIAQALLKAYFCLRNAEHAIQGHQDRQTQKLPEDPDQQLSTAHILGYDQWHNFYEQLNIFRDLVKTEFAAVIAAPHDKSEAEFATDCDWNCIWEDALEPDAYLELLAQHGHENPVRSLEALEDLRMSSSVITMQPASRERLNTFIPNLLAALANQTAATETLCRILPLVKAVARRSAYLLLLIENPGALKQLVQLSAASPWVAQELTLRPALLDELLDQRSLYHAPDKEELIDELRRLTLRIPQDDLEEQMDALRYFRSAHALRVAACEINGSMPLMKVSDYLTWLAEALLDYVLTISWQQMVAQHGYPDGEERSHADFIIVGYGKLGGIELGHGSDLDLVFIHNASTVGYTDGEQRGKKTLDNQTFYMRLAQKMIHLLNTRMASGQLYEIDMRLRPSGNSGMLVSTLKAFGTYQQGQAWTWEHQALVRARAVAGNPELIQQFNDVRHRILCQERDLTSLKTDVVKMRDKMRSHLGSDKNADGRSPFHLKQDRGGIVDIEFMVQYAVLAWAHKVPSVTRFTDNIRILDGLAQSNLMSAHEVDALTDAYKALRSLGHRRTLQQQSSLIEQDMLEAETTNAREQVSLLWRKIFEQ